ncbi:MAG: ATP-binding cassette domain-containing protein [Allosphingosinicella sp.]
MKAELDMSRPPRGELQRFAAGFLRYAGRRAAKAQLLVFAGTLVEGIGLLMLVPLFTLILGPSDGDGLVDRAARALLAVVPAQSQAARLTFLLAMFALLMVLRSVILFNRDVLVARLQVGFIHDLRSRIVALLANSEWDVIARLRHGRVTHVLGSDVQSIRIAANLLIQCTVAAVMLVVLTALALLISPPLALLILVLLAAGGAALWPVLRRSRRTGAALTDANLTMMNSTAQFLGGLKLAMSQNLSDGFVREFDATQVNALRREVDFARQRSATQIALAVSTALVAGLVILIDVAFIGTSASGLATVLVILARTSGPASQIQQGIQHIFHSLPAYAQLTRLETELMAAQRIEERAATGTIPVLESTTIEFRNVRYSHMEHGGEPIGQAAGIVDLTVRIGEGSWIGVAGPSGAGKTTFADLVAGLYAPQAGEILVGGRPLSGTRLGAWRGLLSYVSQDPFLFHDSVRNNLLWARPDATEAEMWDLLALVDAEALVKRLADGLDTVVGERGGLLSGGERQRLAMVRALLRRPRVLLLDEATSAIDIEGEARILAALRTMPRRPMVIMIAHREASFAHVERVITLTRGRIVAERKDARQGG